MARRPLRGRGLKGANRVRKLLKRLPETVSDEIAELFNEAGRTLSDKMRADVPRKTGFLARGVTYRVNRKSLRLRVGIIGKKSNRDRFYARFLEFGRKAQTVDVRRRLSGGRVTRYKLRVSPIAAGKYDFLPFVSEFRRRYKARLDGIWQRALKAASAGATDA